MFLVHKETSSQSYTVTCSMMENAEQYPWSRSKKGFLEGEVANQGSKTQGKVLETN